MGRGVIITIAPSRGGVSRDDELSHHAGPWQLGVPQGQALRDDGHAILRHPGEFEETTWGKDLVDTITCLSGHNQTSVNRT